MQNITSEKLLTKKKWLVVYMMQAADCVPHSQPRGSATDGCHRYLFV